MLESSRSLASGQVYDPSVPVFFGREEGLEVDKGPGVKIVLAGVGILACESVSTCCVVPDFPEIHGAVGADGAGAAGA